jgi:hypothetical protein
MREGIAERQPGGRIPPPRRLVIASGQDLLPSGLKATAMTVP